MNEEQNNRADSRFIIVKQKEREITEETGVFEDSFELETMSLLFFEAVARANYTGPTANAGIRVKLTVNGNLQALNQSFEAQSNTIDFWASAATTMLLPQGHHTVRAERLNNQVTGGYYLRASYVVISS
ncbi:MAG: hypothetical protein AAGN35_04805 [Bacteroidota bacterium]